MNTQETASKGKKKNNILANILINFVIPFFILNNSFTQGLLGPVYGLVVALAFPLGYGLYDFFINKDVNTISVLGVISISLTGVFGLLKLPAEWIAIKEMSVPLIIGIFIALTANSKKPLLKRVLFNDMILKIDLLESKLEEKNEMVNYAVLLKKSSYYIAASFLLSAILNYGLAKYLLVSEPGTIAYNEEIGQMSVLSFPVIAIPCTIIMVWVFWNILKELQKLTGLTLEEIMNK